MNKRIGYGIFRSPWCDFYVYTDTANSLHQPSLISYTDFYNTALDHTDLMAEYYAWQSPQGHATMWAPDKYAYHACCHGNTYIFNFLIKVDILTISKWAYKNIQIFHEIHIKIVWFQWITSVVLPWIRVL